MTNQDLKVESKKVIKKMQQALMENNINQWLAQIESDDDLVQQAQKQWFEVYRQKHQPEKVQFELLVEEQNKKKWNMNVKFL